MTRDDQPDPYRDESRLTTPFSARERRSFGWIVGIIAAVVLMMGATGIGLIMQPTTPEGAPVTARAAALASPAERDDATVSSGIADEADGGAEEAASERLGEPTGLMGNPAPAKDGDAPTTPITRSEALAAIDRYLAAAVEDPGSGWELLTPRRQAAESFAVYAAWWRSLESTHVSRCRYDDGGQLAICDLVTRDDTGLTAVTNDVQFPLHRDGDTILLGEVEGAELGDLSAMQQLERYRTRSLDEAQRDGRWVAVLSAKKPGITDPLQLAANGTNTFELPDILAMHEALQSRVGGNPLLVMHSDDWGKQTGQDLWYTIADRDFHSREDVEAWCSATFPELSGRSLTNQCLPRTLKAPHQG